MSYKPDLSDLDRDGRSLTASAVARIAADIESGAVAPGEKLPTTRELAAQASVNHLTAARIYQRLAEQGYVTARVGRGTFVRARPPVADPADDERWQTSALPLRRSAYAEQMLAESLGAGRDAIALATGLPAPGLLPAEALVGLAGSIVSEGRIGLQFESVEGLPELRVALARLGRETGWAREPDEILVTTGARQAIDLVARAVLEPGDVAVVESPTFAGTLTSLQATGAHVLPLPVDEHGADVEALERLLPRHEVKLVAVQPVAQNPTGTVLSEERRERLVELARDRGFFILEDGVYASMSFDRRERRRLREQAPAHVLYVDSLSKSVGPGLRVGWIAASGPVVHRLTRLKMHTDLHSAVFPQQLAAAWLDGDLHAEHLDRVLPLYRKRRDVLVDAVERRLGDEAEWTLPQGGHHLWVTLRRAIDERALYGEALRSGVAFLPGGAAQGEPAARTSLRLSFSYAELEDLDEGVRRLAQAVRAVHRRLPLGATMPMS